jgi:hypothetical protein
MLDQVDLSGARSPEDAVQVIREAWRAEKSQKIRSEDGDGGEASWLLGGGWDEVKWGGVFPDRSWLDEVSFECTRAHVQMGERFTFPPEAPSQLPPYFLMASPGPGSWDPCHAVPHGLTLCCGEQRGSLPGWDNKGHPRSPWRDD